MPPTAADLYATVTAYLTSAPDQKEVLTPLLDLIDQDLDLIDRNQWAGHMTAAAVILDPDDQVLHIHHAASGKILIPGGHVEPSDRTLLDAAWREVEEETGLTHAELTLLQDTPVHLDIHPIPASETRGEQDHQHFDVRYVFRTHARAPELRLQAEEVTGAQWRPMSVLQDPLLRERVADLAQQTRSTGVTR